MRCVLCGQLFTDADQGYVKGSIAGEVYELLPGGIKPTGQKLHHEGLIFCVKHFQDIPKNIEINLQSNAANRKGKT